MTWKKTWKKSQETGEEDREGCQRQEQHLESSITALSLTHESNDKKSESWDEEFVYLLTTQCISK